MVIRLCLTLVTVSGADTDSLTWLPGLTLDLPHHCGSNMDCWVNLVTSNGPPLLALGMVGLPAHPMASHCLCLPRYCAQFLASHPLRSILTLLLPDKFFMEHPCSPCLLWEY